MILFGLSTSTAEGRRELPGLIVAARQEQLEVEYASASRQEASILATRELAWHESAAISMIRVQREMLEIETRLENKQAERRRARQAMERSRPGPEPEPEPAQVSWEELKGFAEGLAARGAGELPHPVLDHVRQRLGKSQGTRPPVRARTGGDAGEVAMVTGENFRALLDAPADHRWRLLSEAELGRLREFVGGLKPTVAQSRRLARDAPALWSKVRVVDGTQDDNGKPGAGEAYRAVFEEAWAGIVESVEGEVLELIGLPSVHVYAKDPGTFGDNRPGYYDEETQTIHLTGANLTARSIWHEFGHHIEDQGPVEVWIGLASILNWLSGGRPLAQPPANARRPVYSMRRTPEDPEIGLPSLPYSATYYYEDGGTELMSTSLENEVLKNLKVYIRWPDGWPEGMREGKITDRLGPSLCGPELACLLLHALRPGEMRAAGFPNPALLGA